MHPSRSFFVAILGATAAIATPAALAAPNNTSATLAYLRADHALINKVANIPDEESSAESLTREVAAECRYILRGAPLTKEHAQMVSEATLALLEALARPFLGPGVTFASRIEHLRWTSHSLTSLVHTRAADNRAEASVPPPHLCADLKASVATGYQTVPQSTTDFERAYLAARERPEASNEAILHKLARYEGPHLKALAHGIEHLERKIAPLLRDAIKGPRAHLRQALGLSPSP